MSFPDSRVISTRERAGARSHANTCRATRASIALPRLVRLARGRLMPGRADAATRLRIIDTVVIHAAENDEERRFHLLDLLERERRLVELTGVELGAHDMIDRLFDFLRRQIFQDAQ